MKFTGTDIYISRFARLGNGVKIGDHSTIYDNVVIGERSIVSNHCEIGEPLAAYYKDPSYVNPPANLGADCLIRSHSIIYAEAKIGKGLQTGHRVSIREFSVLGNECRIGTLCDIQDKVTIGNHCWLHSNIFLPALTHLGNFVFIYPGAIFTNDPYPPSENLHGVTVEDYAQVGAGAILLPGVRIGMGALVAAGAVVTKDVQSWTLVAGNPAKKIKDVGDILKSSGEKAYPWMKHFTRGMPWQEEGFDKWKESQK